MNDQEVPSAGARGLHIRDAMRGLAALTGERPEELEAAFIKGGPLARVLSVVFSIEKRARGNPRPSRSMEYWCTVGVLKAGGLKGKPLRAAIQQATDCHENQVETWLSEERKARKTHGPVSLLGALFAAPNSPSVQRALQIALEALSAKSEI